MIAGQQFDYTFDNIGNRTTAKFGGDASGGNLRTIPYNANPLNQYTNIVTPGYKSILGVAIATNTVTVNSNTALRKVEYFESEITITNTLGPTWQSVSINAGGNSATGNILFPPYNQTPLYDSDGNLTNDGLWSYTWDAENRLISITSQTNVASAAKQKIDYQYDAKFRRIQKIVSSWNGSNYVPQSTNKFVYDGWNLIAVLDGNNNLLQSFTWGTDLSGSLQGAGGVGGLISMTIYAGTNAGTYFYAYDGNGNVMALVNAANGMIVAQYEYDPFLQVIRATGPLSKINPFLGATKFYDWETSLYYYGYRYYEPAVGRFLNQDPFGELGFEVVANRPRPPPEKLSEFMLAALDAVRKFIHSSPNIAGLENASIIQTGLIYVFVLNNPVSQYDPLGLDCPACDGIGPIPNPITSDGGLRCCAQHDQCFDQNNCSASSWASTLYKLDQLAHGIPVTFTPCEICNLSVLACMVNQPSTGPKYYCRKQHRFINIGNSRTDDFPDLSAAKCACCN